MKKKLLSTWLLLCLFGFNALAQFTQSDFLKTSNTQIRNNSGTGTAISLRGTNLGSWLCLEYWMMPLGVGPLNRSQFTATAYMTASGTSASSVFDNNLNTRWANGEAQNTSGAQTFVIDMGKKEFFNKMWMELGSFTGDYGRICEVTVSDNGVDYRNPVQVQVPTNATNEQKQKIEVNFGSAFARYIKIKQLGSATSNFWSIAEINVLHEDDIHIRRALETRFGAQADEALDAFQDTWITTTDLDNIKNMGMNVVRVPFFFKEIMNEDGTIKANGYKQLDWIINQCKSRRIYVILDLHGAPGGINGFITSGEADATFYWTDASARTKTINLWKNIATRYANEPTVAMYDVLNESLIPEATRPQLPGADYAQKVAPFFDELYQGIRSVDPNHIVCFNAFGSWESITPPSYKNWQNVVYQVHDYWLENAGNPAGMNASIDAGIKRMASYQYKWNVPVYYGEFSLWGDLSNWERMMRGMNNLGASWTNWAYKMTNIESGNLVNRSLYRGVPGTDYNALAPNLVWDPLATVKSKWSAFPTSALQANTSLINTVSSYTTAVPAATPVGRTIWLQSRQGFYVCTEGYTNQMRANRTSISAWEVFKVVDAGNGKIALKGSNNRYVSMINDSTLVCNTATIGTNEKFSFIQVGDWKVGLMGPNNKFVGADEDPSRNKKVTCRGDMIGDWETFTWGDAPTSLAIAAANTSQLSLNFEEMELSAETIIFPNPANTPNITIKTGLKDYSVQILSTDGKLQKVYKGLHGTSALDIKGLVSGVYIVKILNREVTESKRLVIY